MYLASCFFIGSQEDWDNALNNQFWEFYFSRLFFTLFVGGFIFFLGIGLNCLLQKSVKFKKEVILFEVVVILLFAIILVMIALIR